MDRRDFLGKLVIGLPIASVGGAALLRSAPAYATGTPPSPIYVASQYGTTASDVQTAINDAATAGAGLIFESDTFFTIDNLVFGGSGSGYPAFIIGLPGTSNGAVLTASSGATGVLIDFVDPPAGFEFGGFEITGNSSITTGVRINTANGTARFRDLSISTVTSSCLEIQGANLCEFSRISAYTASTGVKAFDLNATSATAGGIASNTFASCVAFLESDSCIGFNLGGSGSTYIVSDNVFLGCYTEGVSHSSLIGFKLDGSALGSADNAFIGCYVNFLGGTSNTGWNINNGTNNVFVACTSNGATNINIGSTTSSIFLGGSSSTVALTGSSKGVVMIGSHGSTSITGNTNAAGNIFFINDGTDTPFAYNPSGLLHAGKLSASNAVSNAHTPSGATSKALPFYDNAGTLIGYMPIYAAQW